MSLLRREGRLSNLSPVGIESPGSSVFDLPARPPPDSVQLDMRPTLHHEGCTNSEPGVSVNITPTPRYLVISGGTGGNSICSAFGDACYILPVSDDGGSSSEIIRVLGGPSIGA
jgi:hypothetical protein